MASTVNMGQSASIPITSSEYDDYTRNWLINGKEIEQLLGVIEGDTTTGSVNGNGRGHEIRKRSPLPPWAPPLYAICALGTKIGKVTGGILTKPLAFTYPVVLPSVGKLFLAGICPKLGLTG